MSKTTEEMEKDNLLNSYKAFLTSINAVKEAMSQVKAKLYHTSTPYNERNKLEAKKLELESELIKLYDQLNALQSKGYAIKAPTIKQIEKIKELTDEVDRININQATAEEVLAAASKTLDSIQSIQKEMGVA